MADTNRLDRVFESASKSTIMTSVPTICLFILGILLIILSALQAVPIAHDSAFEDALNDLCESDIIGFLSPFHFKFTLSEDPIGCPWRVRNTAFRLTIVCIMIISCIVSLIVLFSGKLATAWPVLYWLNWIVFVLMFVAFVLDCDGINTGIDSCNNDFKVEDTSVLAIGATINGVTVEVETCYYNPFIYTALCDFVASLMAFCAYKISKYYIFDPTARKMSVTTKKSSVGGNNKVGNSTNTGNTVQETTMAINNANTKKDDSPDPFVEYQGSYEVDRGNNNNTAGAGGGVQTSAYDE